MSRTTYPFGPIRPPRPTPNPDPGNTGSGPRPPRVDPPVGPTPPGNGGSGTRPPRVDPPVGPTGPGYNPAPPPVPGSGPGLLPPQIGSPVQPGMTGMTGGDVRSQALESLLGRAAQYGDRGDSTKTLTDLLNGVDMGGAGRATDSWATRQRVLTDTGNTYTQQLAAALKAMRDKAGSGGGYRSGGGGGGGGLMPAGGLTEADYLWLDEYMKGLTAPKAPKGYTPAVVTQGPPGYGASQHPLAPVKPKPLPKTPMRLI